MDRYDLSDFFVTEAQAADYSDRLSTIYDQIYQTDFQLENCLTNQFGVTKRDKFMNLLKDNNINIDSNTLLQEFIKHLQEYIKNLPKASVTLSFEPDQLISKSISVWFFQNTNNQVLLNIDVQPQIINGIIIDINGKHGDYSIKNKFNQIVEEAVQAKD